MNVNELEQQIRGRIEYHQSHSFKQWRSADSKQQTQYKLWYERAFKHFQEKIRLEIRQREEGLIDVYPMKFFWSGGSEYKQGAFDSRPFVYKYGSFGTGYLAQTDCSLYIVSLKELTEKYPLFAGAFSTEGFLDRMIAAMAGERDSRRPLKEDVEEVIPLSAIKGAKIAKGNVGMALHVHSQAGPIEIYSLFEGDDELVLAAIRMFQSRASSLSSDQESNEGKSETIALLKQIRELYEAGVLSEEEFAEKKRELLARL